jgi:hypothetical protein
MGAFRFICPKLLRQTFHEFAGCSIQRSEWARAYCDHLRNDKNKSHQVAVRFLAFKLRIIYRCWKDGNPMTRPSICSLCADVALACGHPRDLHRRRVEVGSRLPKLILKTILDGLAQKTPLLQRWREAPRASVEIHARVALIGKWRRTPPIRDRFAP